MKGKELTPQPAISWRLSHKLPYLNPSLLQIVKGHSLL